MFNYRTISHPNLAFILAACLKVDSFVFHLSRYEAAGNMEMLVLNPDVEISAEAVILYSIQIIKAIFYLHENTPVITIGNLRPTNILVLGIN
jgi:hypothetical protein